MNPTGYRTRSIRVADQGHLWEAIYHAIFVPPGEDAPPRDVVLDPLIARYVEGWGARGDFGLLAVLADDTPIGAAWVRLLQGERHGFGFLDDSTPELAMAVWPDYRGQGIGSRLLAELLTECDRQWEAISLSVSQQNRARRLYRRCGFETTSDDGSSLTMRRVRA